MTDTIGTTHDPLTLHVLPDAVAPPTPTRPAPSDRFVTGVAPEALDRVLATSADLVVHGRRVTVLELVRLTGLEPDDVQGGLDTLCARGTLEPVGAEPQHYVFPAGRWPLG